MQTDPAAGGDARPALFSIKCAELFIEMAAVDFARQDHDRVAHINDRTELGTKHVIANFFMLFWLHDAPTDAANRFCFMES